MWPFSLDRIRIGTLATQQVKKVHSSCSDDSVVTCRDVSWRQPRQCGTSLLPEGQKSSYSSMQSSPWRWVEVEHRGTIYTPNWKTNSDKIVNHGQPHSVCTRTLTKSLGQKEPYGYAYVCYTTWNSVCFKPVNWYKRYHQTRPDHLPSGKLT